MWRTLCSATLAVCLGGCASGPLQENPVLVRVDRGQAHENPIYIPQGPMAYARVFEKIEDILSDYFVIALSFRHGGRIETYATIAPGLEQPWKPGSPDVYQRVLAFFQTIRHRAVVHITTANDGGYFVDVKVLKELEDLPAPSRSTAGEATYRMVPTVERQYEIVAGDVFDPAWIPLGRDHKLEQCILDRLSRMDISTPCK